MTPAADLLAKAQAMLKPGDALALCSDAWSYRKNGYVLLAVARPIGGLVLRIDANEYDGLAVMRLAGMKDVTTDEPIPAEPPDIEQLLKEKNALRTRKPR